MDQSILKGTKPTHVIECKDSSGVKCSSIEGSQLKGNGYIDAETTTTTSLNVISCTEEGCTSTKKSIVSGNSIYFINAPDITKVVKCTNTASTINCDLTTNPAYAGAIVRELFVDGLVSGNTITCISSSTQGCISSKALPYCTNANDDSGKCTTGTPIADDSYCIKPDGKIYKSSIIPQSRKRSPTHQCTVVDANKNYLFKTSDNKLGTFGTDSGIIYNCIAGSICTQVISSSIFDDNTHKEYLYTCNDNGICTGKASDIQPGSYIAGAPTLSNNNPRVSYNYIINCQVSVAANCTSTLIADSAEKYYDDALISENLIHCNGSNQCISKNPGGSEAEPYHYLDNANSLNIITCTGASCSSQPGSRVQDNAYIDATTTKKILVYGTKMVQDNGPQSKSMIDGSNPKLVITGDGSKNVVISDKSTLEGYEFLTAGTDYYTITCTSAGCISSKIGIGLCKDVKDNNYGKCKNPSGEDVADGFYISTNGKIYESKTSGPSCKAIALNKTYLFVGTSVVVLDEDYVGNDGDKPIYRCNDATCSQLIGSTILIKDGDTPKYAYTCNADGDACSKTTVVEGYYLAGLPTVAEGKILYDLMQCTEADDITSCAMITPEDGYYTDVEKNLLLCKDGQCYKPPTPNLGYYVHAAPDATDPLEEALIVCSKPAVAIECVVESAKVGYYLNQGEDILTNQLIHCTSEGCATDQANEGYYINNESSDSAHPDYITHVIKCQHSGFNCATMAHAGSGTQVTHYLSGDTKQVITCSLNSCELERITTKGYFLNSGDLLADAKTIRCTGTGDSPCTNILDADLGGSAIGKVKKELSDLKFCLDSDCDPNYELKNDVLTTTYKTITIAAANDFPSITTQNTIITVKLGAGAAILMEESGLPACLESIPSTDVCYTGALKGQYCFHATSKKIYQSVVGQDGSKSCIAITGNGDEAPLFYFTLSTGKKLDQLENTNADVVAYQCTFSSSTLSGCELFKGYTLVGSNTIHCNGWLGNGCEVTPVGSLSDSCSGGEGGLVKTKLSLCFKTFKLVLPTKEEDVKTITFLATGGNMEYGKNEGEIVFLSVSSRMVKVISAPKPSTDQYYFNQLVANTSNKNAMIKCNSSGCSAVKFSSSGADDFVGKNAIIDAGDPNSKTLIYQKSNSYTYNDRTSDIENGTLYFVNELDQSKLIVCTKASGCKAEAGSITPGHAYIDETPISSSFKTIIITCENGGSGSVCTANDRSGDLSTSDLFYIDGKETDKVIICNSTTKCKSSKGSIANGHAYISSKDEDKKTIITCNTTQGCTTKSLSSELVGDKKKYYICGHDITHLIECTASGCEIESSARESGTEIDGINEERTIICSEYGCISSTAIASACENDIAESTTSLCKDSQNQVINENYFCFDTGSNKIFKSTSETKKCKDQTEDVFLEKTADSKYKEGVWGTTPNGLIYQCNGSRCQQVISSYYLGKKGQDKYLYKCDDSGSCDIVNRISVGFYLSGEPIVGSTLKYTQMIQCTEPLGEKCGKVGVIGEGYYIDAGSPGNIIYCEDDGEGNKQCSTGKAETDQGFAYVDQGTASSGVSKSVITCDEEKCVSSEKSKLIEHPKKLYFISATDTKKLITCQYGEEVGGVRPFSCETDGEDASANTALLDGSDANYTIRCDGENPCESKIECRVNTGANCDAGKYYNVADSTQSILEVREDQNGDLFYCKEDSEKESGVGCSLIENAGYYINSNSEIFTCKGTTLKCQKNSIDSNSCSSETNISQLFIDNNNKINLCVHHDGTTAYPTLLSSTEKTFLVEYEPSTNEFKHEGTKYAFAKVSENSVIMDKNYNFTKNNHVYVNVKTKAVLVEGQCPAHTGSPLTTVVEEHDCDTTKYICDPSA